VSIWRDTSVASQKPDVVLGRASNAGLVSASTLVEPVAVAFDGKRLFVGDAGLHRVLVWNSLPVADDQPADAVLGQPDFSSAAVADVPAANTLRTPAALVSDGANLFVADAADRRILIFTPGDTALTADAVVNSASLLATPLAAGSLVTIRGKGLGDASSVEVLLNGAPLPLLSESDEEIQVQAPYELGSAGSGSLYIRTEHSNGTIGVTNAVAVKFASAFPGLYAFGGNEPRSGLMLHAGAGAEAAVPVTPESPAIAGEVVTLWGTGLGLVNGAAREELDADVQNPVSAWVNGAPAEVVSAKLPQGALGVYEVRVLLPADVAAKKTAQLYIAQAGNTSNTVTFPVVQENE
jgi:uncharacterized protein (TIGR03437 family)